MIGALVALTLAGGLGQVGNLGQVFSGPRLPAPIAPSARSDGSAQASSPLLLAQAAAGTAAPDTIASGTTAHRRGTPSRRSPHAGSIPSGGPFRRPPGLGSGGRGPAGPGGGGSGSQPQQPVPAPPSGGPTPPPTSPPTLVSRVTGAAASVTSRVPGPAGAAATQAVEAVGAAAAQVAPLNAPAPAPVQAPAQTITSVVTLGAA
jgi:hypothetical protein